jgi:hypothetical protein
MIRRFLVIVAIASAFGASVVVASTVAPVKAQACEGDGRS